MKTFASALGEGTAAVVVIETTTRTPVYLLRADCQTLDVTYDAAEIDQVKDPLLFQAKPSSMRPRVPSVSATVLVITFSDLILLERFHDSKRLRRDAPDNRQANEPSTRAPCHIRLRSSASLNRTPT